MDPTEKAQAAGDAHGVPMRVWMFLGVVIASSWGWLLYSSHYFWSPDSYYNYGWIVPVLAGYILYRRVDGARFVPEVAFSRARLGWLIAGLVVSMVFVALIRLVVAVDPFWRLPLWAYALVMVGITCFSLLLITGWKGCRQLAFPILFLLLALPWPMTVETTIIQSLTHWVTELTVIAVNLVGYPAESMGNTILIGDIHVGVDEACSGIRSLQTLVMVAFFLGEYSAFGTLKRMVLIAGSVVIALFMNGIRAIVLTMVTVKGTPEQFDFWHDTLGNINAVAGALLLFGLTELISYFLKSDGRTTPVQTIPVARLQPPLAAGLVSFTAIGFLASALLVNGYYLLRERNFEPLPALALQWPEDGSVQHEPVDFSQRTIDQLQCDYAAQANVRWSFGMQASVIHYGYTGEDLMASLAGFGHSPLICMTSIGARLVEQKPQVPVSVQGLPWTANHYEFAIDRPGRKPQAVQVFWLVWEPLQMGLSSQAIDNRSGWSNRLAPVLHGRRDFGRQVLLVYINGDFGDDFIRRKFQDLLDRITVLEENPS